MMRIHQGKVGAGKLRTSIISIIIVLVILLGAAITLAGTRITLAKARAGAVPTITQYPLQVHPSQVRGITKGPDGALWFADSDANSIGRITTNGIITYYALPTANALPTHITSGPDGALWFTEANAAAVGRITTAGAITEYATPTAGSTPWDITAGPDGALWFTEEIANSIGHISTTGTITEYALPASAEFPYGITTGPDGALWFTQSGPANVGRITTSGIVTEYTIASSNVSTYGITAGSDGTLWFSEQGQPNGTGAYENIGRITTAGAVTYYPLPTNADPTTIAAGVDGALWFSDGNPNGESIGRITTSGSLAEYALPPTASPWDITAGPDNAMWFTEDGTNSIGRITSPIPAAPANLTIPSPAQNPQLSWDSVSGASSYNIYRNGSLVGSSSTASFIDMAAPEGTDTYYVTAVSGSDESAPSNSVSVLVDRTAPTVSNLQLSSRRIVGSQPLTITANAADTRSGVANAEFYVDTDPGQGNGTPMAYTNGTITATTSFSSLSIGRHTIFVRAKDKAGNWSTTISAAFTYTP